LLLEDADVDRRNAQEAGAPGWLGECDISVSLLPFAFAPVRQEGANSGHSPIAGRTGQIDPSRQ
jgi:hypothetical protein